MYESTVTLITATSYSIVLFQGGYGGAVVIAFTSHQSSAGSGIDTTRVEFDGGLSNTVD